MALTNAYLTLSEVKGDLGITDYTDDGNLERAINTASRLIDGWCGQRFWKDAADTVRYFTAGSAGVLRLSSAASDLESRRLVSVTSVALDTSGNGTFNETWTEDTEFYLAPRGAEASDRPYDRIATLNGNTFPSGWESVKVTGVFGWPAVPTQVKEACAIQAGVLFKRTTEGAAPIVTMDGTTLRSSKFLDMQAQLLLRPYQILVVA